MIRPPFSRRADHAHHLARIRVFHLWERAAWLALSFAAMAVMVYLAVVAFNIIRAALGGAFN